MAGVASVRFKPKQLGMMLVVLLCAVVHLASSLRSCAVSSGKMRTANSEFGYFRSDSNRVQVRVRLRDEPHCREVYRLIDLDMGPLNVDYTYDIDMNELTGINTTVITATGRQRRGLWYEVGIVSCKWVGLFLRIGSHKRSLPLNKTIVTELQTMASLGLLEGRRDLSFPCYPTHVDFLIAKSKMGCAKTQHDGESKPTCAQTIALPSLTDQSLPPGFSEPGLLGPEYGGSFRGGSSAKGSSSGSPGSGSLGGGSSSGGSSSGGSSGNGSSESDPVAGMNSEGLGPISLQTPPPPLPPTPPPFFASRPSIIDSISPPEILREANIPPDHTGAHDTYEFRGQAEENAVPIFIGVLAFSLSMCLRFCLCRGKSVVQRVTTVTVIRSRPTGEGHESQENVHDPSLDPPPAYVDVVNEGSGTCHSSPVQDPPPPPYSDIDPPPYYELEGVGAQDTTTQHQSTPPQQPHTSPLQPHTSPQPTTFSPPYHTPTEQLHSTPQGSQQSHTYPQQPHTTPTEQQEPSDSPSASVGSNLARAIQSRARSLQKQFSFRPLEEEDEEEDK